MRYAIPMHGQVQLQGQDGLFYYSHRWFARLTPDASIIAIAHWIEDSGMVWDYDFNTDSVLFNSKAELDAFMLRWGGEQ